MSTLKKPSQIDNALFIEKYNDLSLSNAQLCEVLETNWDAVKTKSTVNKTVASQLTAKREGGAKGSVKAMSAKEIEKQRKSAPVAKTSAPVKTAVTESSTETAGTTEEEPDSEEVASGPASVKVTYFASSSDRGEERTFTEENLEKVFVAIQTWLAQKGANKVNFFKAGAPIEYLSIADGDAIVVRRQMRGGC
jgi:hypothetical protein